MMSGVVEARHGDGLVVLGWIGGRRRPSART